MGSITKKSVHGFALIGKRLSQIKTKISKTRP